MVNQPLEHTDVSRHRSQLSGVQFLADGIENCRLYEPDSEENCFRKNKSGRRRNPWLIASRENKRCRHVKHAMLYLQPTGCLDFADRFLDWHSKAERFLDRSDFARSWIDNINPSGSAKRVLSGPGEGV